MRKIPSRKFPTGKKKIPSRPFSKAKTKIPSQKFAKGTAKIPSRKSSEAPEAEQKKPDVPRPVAHPTNRPTRQDRLASLKEKSKSVTPASYLESPGLEPMVMQSETFRSPHSNLFAAIPQHLPNELFTTLVQSANIRIERIVSRGHASADGFWFDQDQHESVIVLKGAARLRFEDGVVELKPGDFLNIPAHKRHRVEWTTPDEPTIWLAVFYG